ncbi:hypothetical protein LHJ74_24455 [Streptomyces sp. N2-109]|uniref:Integral membrane protein n=1 Tax=Streptomyces gossypii TaxID=2883101 RepID=A0ABT2JYV8_9ACTN|nr:hypothetical protein [Streptomyces gossypii]MCT2593026.1 hypothetical protein [Streptomyces gossypii]
MSPSSRSRSGAVKRSRVRRAGESAFGVLLLARSGLMALLAGLLLVAGVWTSWETAKPAMFASEREQGTLSVEKCADDTCRGTYSPDDTGERGATPERVTLGQLAAPDAGERVPVALRSGTDEVVRTGVAGVLYAWVPLAGALVLAALVVAGGLRLRRTAWVMGLLGLGIMGSAFLAL